MAVIADNSLGKAILQAFGQARSERANWDSQLQDLRELVRLDTKSFNSEHVPGDRRYDGVFDGTAVDACEEFASGLHAYLSSPTERWFELGIAGLKPGALADDADALEWLELVAERIYTEFADVRTNFNTGLHETYLDLGAFGTSVFNSEWHEDGHIIFKTNPLAEFFPIQGSKGKVNEIFHYFEQTCQQIRDEYEKDGMIRDCKAWRELENPVNTGKKYKVIRHVFPRTSVSYKNVQVPAKNKPWASITVLEKTGDVIRISGYDSFPYAVPRWVHISGEVMGRSPAMKCLPNIMSLQTMERTILKAGQKAVDPPLIFEDDAFLEPLSTAPGSIMFKEAGAEFPQALDFKGNLSFGVEQNEAQRAYIRKCFHTEWFKRFKKNREQSATEVLDDRDEMLRMLAPMMGRQQTELLGPVIERTYLLLHMRGYFPPAPASLQGKKLTIAYISPAARAQQGVKADRISRFMQDLVPVAQIDPTVMDALKGDELVKVFANARGVPQSVLRSKTELEDVRAQRQQQQSIAAAAQTAEPASKALLNVAQAQQAAGGGLPGGPIG